jgi:polar amino acid transport system permease protein
MQAARALGMRHFQAMRRIVFPQMLGYLLPSLTNQTIGLIKESAVLSVIGVPEMAMAGQIVLGETFSPVETYVMIAVLYWILTAMVAAAMLRVEHRLVFSRAKSRSELLNVSTPT